MISIILVEPENPGNIGAVARVMKNFGYDNLILVSPKADHLCSEAKNRAKHAQEVLNNAVIIEHLPLDMALIATTAKLGSEYNIKRAALTPESLKEKIQKVSGKIGIVFGREGPGLTNDEISLCDFVVTIPATKYNSLNLSHAVAIILYELSKGRYKHTTTLATQKEKALLLEKIRLCTEKMNFQTKERCNSINLVWKRIIGKSMLTKREYFALMGFFRKLK
ncbi:MAG: RNA methyltransferase [Candidatus Woesearchaeota archaeon]